MRVLGIDPGTVHTGFGVIEDGDDLVFVECGVLEAAAAEPIERRLLAMPRGLVELIGRSQPQAVAIEEPFVVQAARKSAMAVGEARAMAMIAAAGAGIPVFQYTPTRVRQAVTSYGASSKEQVRQMVGLLLSRPLDGYSLDACDALAVAICHLRESRLGAMIGEQDISPKRGRRDPPKKKEGGNMGAST